MSGRMDFFEVVKNLHPTNQAWKRYDRNYSGSDGQGPLSPVSQMQSMQVQRDTNKNKPIHHQQDHVSGHTSWTDHNPMVSIPKVIPMLMENTGPFSSIPPFAYNEVHPRTSAHRLRCPSCDNPLMVQVTADLYYHIVTFIPAAMGIRNETAANSSIKESEVLSHGPQEYGPVPEPFSEPCRKTEVSTLDTDRVEPEEQPEMVTAPKEEAQKGWLETKGFRSYASITAGKTLSTKGDNQLEETGNDHQKVRLGHVEVGYVQVIADDNAKENTQEDGGGDDDDDDASNNGFTTVVSWKKKSKAKAEAKAAAYGHGRWKNNKHGNGSPREEHDKNRREPRDEHSRHARGRGRPRDDKHNKNDKAPRGELLDRDDRARRDEQLERDDRAPRGEQHHRSDRVTRGEHNGRARGGPRDGHNEHGRGQRDEYRGSPRDGLDKHVKPHREENTPRRERGQQKK